MANKTICQTPGAQFYTHISSSAVECKVDLPKKLELDEQEAKLLEANLHNALELVLARYFTPTQEDPAAKIR